MYRHPILESKETEQVTIYVDGEPVMANQGEPIAAALIRAGKSIFRYTEKKKTPRGLFCGIGQCNDCVMIVNGVSDVRTCVTIVEEGMVIKTQHGRGRVGVKVDED